jgi:hypothetical protein
LAYSSMRVITLTKCSPRGGADKPLSIFILAQESRTTRFLVRPFIRPYGPFAYRKDLLCAIAHIVIAQLPLVLYRIAEWSAKGVSH